MRRSESKKSVHSMIAIPIVSFFLGGPLATFFGGVCLGFLGMSVVYEDMFQSFLEMVTKDGGDPEPSSKEGAAPLLLLRDDGGEALPEEEASDTSTSDDGSSGEDWDWAVFHQAKTIEQEPATTTKVEESLLAQPRVEVTGSLLEGGAIQVFFRDGADKAARSRAHLGGKLEEALEPDSDEDVDEAEALFLHGGVQEDEAGSQLLSGKDVEAKKIEPAHKEESLLAQSRVEVTGVLCQGGMFEIFEDGADESDPREGGSEKEVE